MSRIKTFAMFMALLLPAFVAGTQAQAGEVLQRVISSGKLRVAVMGSLPP